MSDTKKFRKVPEAFTYCPECGGQGWVVGTDDGEVADQECCPGCNGQRFIPLGAVLVEVTDE